MTLCGLHYSDFFKDNLITGKIKGTILKGKWSIPVEDELFVYIAPENVETSREDKKIGVAKIISCRYIKVGELSDKEAKICAYENGESLKQGVKHWHKCNDSDTVTLVEFDFRKI